MAYVDRPRLTRLLAGPETSPIVVLAGPAGSGKSVLVRELCSTTGTLYFRVGNQCATFARFVHGFAKAVAGIAPGAYASFPRAWERALQSHSPSAVLAHWMCEHLAGLNAPIAIDDLHAATADPSIASFIGKFAELRPNAPLTLAVRGIGALPIALWMATGRLKNTIDETDLRFDRHEVAAAAELAGVVLDEREIHSLLVQTGGLPIAVAYVLLRLAYDPRSFTSVPMPASFEAIAERIFARRSGRERAFLFSASLYPSVDAQVLRLSGWTDAPAIIDTLASDAAFMWEPQAPGGFRFYDRFREYLGAQFQARDLDFRSTIAHRTVESLTRVGRHAHALEVATHQRLFPVMGTVLDAHGFEILESGEVDVIGEALAAFTTSAQELGACALALKGYMEARSGRLDTAEAWFRLGLDTARDEGSRVAIAMYYARELALRRREDACEVLAPFADSQTLTRALLIDVRSSYAQALTVANRLEEACARTDEALALLGPDCAPALRARVFARAAYVALESGQAVLARERARIAAPLAVTHALYDVAASTYSVLYNIAYEVDDDAATSLDCLRQVRDLGVKSGTLRLDLYALLGMYDLYAEAGNETALTELGREIASVDKHDAAVGIMEGLLPAKALQAAWIGEFGVAERILRPIALHQPTPLRTALCWAQIGLYCAAGGNYEPADAAARCAEDALALDEAPTTTTALTLATLALMSWVKGDAERAWRWKHAADAAQNGPAPRLRALSGVLTTLLKPSASDEGFARGVSTALAQLHAVSFGGMAKLIGALPYRFAAPAGVPQTLGSALLSSELSARFAAAAAGSDARALRSWLDTQRPAAFGSLPIAARFEQWALQNTAPNRYPRTALGAVRRQLAAYRPQAPAIIRHSDDIDVSIAELFEHLDVAAPLMAEHSRAVSAWCSRLARAFNLSENEILFITRSGLIHDIGKMRTPATILNAPRQLDSAEWIIMRDHAAQGSRIVASLPALSAFVPIVRGHHERLDGNGYPDGLRAAAIPLAARIVSVADSFNAMIGRRPYRSPLAPTAALDELQRHRATQFDPEVVEAMVRIVLGRVVEQSARGA